MRRPVLTLLLLSILTFALGLGRQAITDADEAYYAEASREMVLSGDWLTPRFNFHDRWEKPVLYYWLTAATYRVIGLSEYAARLWSALSGIGLVCLTWTIGLRSTRSQESAWLAGAIVASCFGYFAMARSALPDLPLALCITSSIWAALRASDPVERRDTAWWLAAGCAGGLGFLMKGPVALVVPTLVLLPIWWRERRAVRIRRVGVAAAFGAAALIGLPWYLAMTAEHGVAYLRSFFVENNLQRFATDRYNEPRPFWFYVPILIGGMLPWSAYMIVAGFGACIAAVRGRVRLDATEWRLAIWAAVPVFFFSASVGQQPRYILPVLPPLALLLATALTTRIVAARAQDGAARRVLAVGTWLTVTMIGMYAVLLVRIQPLVTVDPAIVWVGIAGLGIAAFVLAWTAATHDWPRLPAIMAASSVLVLLVAQFGVLASRRPDAVEQMATLVRTYYTGAERVGPYQVFVRNLGFYTGLAQEDLFDESRAAAFLASPARVLLVVRQSDLSRLERLAGVRTRTLGHVEYLNAANIRLGTLLRPDEYPRETVVLVTNREAEAR